MKVISIVAIVAYVCFNSSGYIFAAMLLNNGENKPSVIKEGVVEYKNVNKNISPLAIEDFEEDHEKAVKWAEENFKVWNGILTAEQKQLLEDTVRFQGVNSELEKFRGQPIKDETIGKDVDRMDEALKDSNAKLNSSVYLYKNLRREELGYTPGSFYEKDKIKINREQFRQFSNDFKYGMIHDFMSANLTQHSGDQSQPILFHLKVPKGSSMGHLKEDQVFINRNQGFEVKSMKIITVKGREVIKVEAELVPATDVHKKVQNIENEMNADFKKEMGLDGKAVNLSVDSFYSSRVAERSKMLFQVLIKQMPKKSLPKTISRMKKDGAITFTDHDMTISGKAKDTKGAFEKDSKSLWVQINHEGHNQKKDEDINTLFREFGRAHDNLLFNNQSEKVNFKKIYEEEKNKIKIDDSIKKNTEEFFAGVFGYLLSPDSGIRKQIVEEAPGTAKFIKFLFQPNTSFDGVKNYLIDYKILSQNFITKAEARKLGWGPGEDLNQVAPGKSIGGDEFKNHEQKLPTKKGRVWYEADIDYKSGSRGSKRILYANDKESNGKINEVTLIYTTEDHYQNFKKIYEKDGSVNYE
ncbi:ADP-ribosyltransferase [Bacillus mycoides]|uniref:ADP-ribosyltransferase n=1 Tax=Bacillus mycoides TaxID=1405 RepID=UPI003D651855